MEKFLEQLLGTTDLPTYAAWFIWAFIGVITELQLCFLIIKVINNK